MGEYVRGGPQTMGPAATPTHGQGTSCHAHPGPGTCEDQLLRSLHRDHKQQQQQQQQHVEQVEEEEELTKEHRLIEQHHYTERLKQLLHIYLCLFWLCTLHRETVVFLLRAGCGADVLWT